MISRRNALALLGSSALTGIAGCSVRPFGQTQEYLPVTFENDDDTAHMMSVAVTTIPDEGLGFTEFFSDTWLVAAGGEHTFDDGLGFTDYEPEVMALVVLEDETATRQEFTFEYDLSRLRILVTEGGEIEVIAQKPI